MLQQMQPTLSTGRSFIGPFQSQMSAVGKPMKIDIGQQFSRFPAARVRSDGPYSGQRFREEHLVPALKQPGVLVINLDGPLGYGSSFLEEAFAGLVRNEGYTPDELDKRLVFEARDRSLIDEIREYIDATRH